jgi:hypothetical protein
MKLIGVESPLAGTPPHYVPSWLHPLAERVLRERNRHYGFQCIRSELLRGNAPYASHLLFDQPGMLSDGIKLHRKTGIAAG